MLLSSYLIRDRTRFSSGLSFKLTVVQVDVILVVYHVFKLDFLMLHHTKRSF